MTTPITVEELERSRAQQLDIIDDCIRTARERGSWTDEDRARYDAAVAEAERLDGTRELGGERGELVFPCAALLCLSRLRALASCGLLLLSADKGAHAADDVLSPMPGWSVHGSCSLSVNYHAIAEWTRAQGGQCMHRQSRESGLSLNAFAFGLPELGETRLAFDAHLSSGGPGDLFLLKKFLENHYDSLSLEQTLSLLRLAAFDGQIFAGCVGNLRRQISAGGLSAGLRTDLTAALEKVRELYFPIGEARALEPEIAQLLGLLQAASG